MDVHVRKLLGAHDDCVAVWQLRKAGLGERAIRTLVGDWQRMYDGVYLAAFAAPTPVQRWRAATLTAPTSALSHFGAAVSYGIFPDSDRWQFVTRPGTGGRRTHDRLVVYRSTSLNGDVTRWRRMSITTPERTAIDLSPLLDDRARRKMVREALRLRVTTVPSLDAAVEKHRGRRGTAALKTLTALYSTLQLERCKSDAEAYAMELLAIAKRPLPDVNEKVNNLEADLSWPAHRLIIEIDGPQFHRDKLEDARKTASWEEAGWTVRRIPSDDIFNRPTRLLALAPTA